MAAAEAEEEEEEKDAEERSTLRRRRNAKGKENRLAQDIVDDGNILAFCRQWQGRDTK